MTQKQLHSELEKTEASIVRLQQSLSSSREQLAKLKSDRGDILVAARTDGDPQSRAKFNHIDSQLTALKAEITADEEALTVLQGKFGALSGEAATKAWETERKKLSKFLEEAGAAEVEQRLAKAAIEVRSVMAELAMKYLGAFTVLREFSPSLEHEAQEIRALIQKQADILSVRLDGVISPPMHHQWREIYKDKGFAMIAAGAFDDALTALNLLEPEVTDLDFA